MHTYLLLRTVDSERLLIINVQSSRTSDIAIIRKCQLDVVKPPAKIFQGWNYRYQKEMVPSKLCTQTLQIKRPLTKSAVNWQLILSYKFCLKAIICFEELLIDQKLILFVLSFNVGPLWSSFILFSLVPNVHQKQNKKIKTTLHTAHSTYN